MGMAQPRYAVSGRVVDARRNEPLPAALVMLKHRGDSNQYWAVTSQKGYFEIKVPPGSYTVVVRMLGYRMDTLHWQVKADRYFGNIGLRPSPVTLKEAAVVESARKVEVDRESYVITDSLRKGTISAREVLEKLPGMSYIPHTDELRLDGDANILLLVNGMEKDPTYIKTLPPERIRKVEIIRNPVGRYGLEGYAAVINILLFEDYHGVQLNVSQMGAFSLSRKYNEFPVINTNGWANLTYAAGPVTFYLSNQNYAGWISSRKRERRHMHDGILRINSTGDSFSGRYDFWTLPGQAGMDYFMAADHQLNLEAAYEEPMIPSRDSSRLLMQFPDSTILRQENVTDQRYHRRTLTARYTGKLSPRLGLRSQLKRQGQADEEETVITWNDTAGYSRRRHRRTAIWSAYLEGDYMLNRFWTFSAGYAYRGRRSRESVWQHTEGGASLPDSFLYADSKHQGYLYLSRQNNGWGIKAGTAVEAIRTENDRGYGYRFLMPAPALDLLWKPHPMLSVKAKYRGTVDYPSTEQLSPVRTRLDALIFQEGDPSLQPMYAHNASVELRALHGAVRLEPFVKHVNRYVALTGTLHGDTLLLRYAHAGRFRKWGVKFSGGLPLGLPGLMIMGSGEWYRENLLVAGVRQRVADWYGQVGLMYQRQAWSLVAGALYLKSISRHITPLGFSENSGVNGVLCFVQKGLGRQRQWQVTAFYVPPLAARPMSETYQRVAGFERIRTTEMPAIINATGIRLTYNFHKGQVRKMRREFLAPVDEDTDKTKKKTGFF